MVKKLPLWAGQENLRWLFVRQALEVLISEAESRGHGGTIVLLDAKASIPLALFQPKYVMHGTQWLPLLLKSCAENEMNQSLHWGIEIKYRKSTLDSLQRVAQLAAIDGALVVNSKFEVIAFGATLCAPEWQGKVEIGPDGFGVSVGTLFDLTRYGTRHRSAANFAAACSDSIVFVISQDGPVRAFARADDRLLCWPDCSNSMFV